jgi:DegV family protein with EDD domain
MSHRIALITDSTCDIPSDWVRQYEIGIVPLTIIFGDQQYLDGVDMTAAQFYERLPKESVHPTTSQPTPRAFTEAYQAAAAAGAEQILAITISAAMSGTVQSARQAAEESQIPVMVMDGKNNSMGLGWQVVAAARVRDAGGDLEAMAEAARQVQEDLVYYVTLDTIDYLARGGRIAGAAHFLDSLLRIKPLIYVRPETGAVGPSLPARSRKSALEGLYKEFFRHIPAGHPLHIAVLHNDAVEEAQALAEQVRREHSPKELLITITSPVLGTHTGPRAVALCGYAER